ncbi:hypothetical protein BS78_04G128400 [Paspalum vaginatum]|nr:hypothetical protein BS78_04G128400 [Paspalum vaginatum]
MASGSNVHVGKPPHFDGNNYDYWKTRMTVHLRAMVGRLSKIVNDGYVILKQDELTPTDEENILVNDQAMNVLYDALDVSEFNRIKNLKNAHEIWTKLMEIHEGTTMVKSAKLYVVSKMFNQLNEIVNELKGLGFDVLDEDFSDKFLRSLPSWYDTIFNLLVRSNLKATSPPEVLGEVLTHDIFKRSQEEAHGEVVDEKKKCITLKAKSTKVIEEDDSDDEASDSGDDEEMALFVRRFNKFMKKKKGFSRKNQSSKKNPFNERKCFECGEPGRIAMYCPNKKKKDRSVEEKKKKKFIEKQKNRQDYLVEWDSDASSDSDDEGEASKLIADITIKEAPSLFSTSHCLMAKGGSKVYDDDMMMMMMMMMMIVEADDYMYKEKEKFKALKKLYKSLQVSFEELKTSHENLKEAHEKLEEAQISQPVHEATMVKVDMGVTLAYLIVQ